MSEQFDFRSWITQNKVGPYSKNNSNKKIIKESDELDGFADKYQSWRKSDSAKEPFRDKKFDPSSIDLKKLDKVIQSKYRGAVRGDYPFGEDDTSDSLILGDLKDFGTFIAWYDWEEDNPNISPSIGPDDDFDDFEDELGLSVIGILVQHIKDKGICVYEINGEGEINDGYGEPRYYVHAYGNEPYTISTLSDNPRFSSMNEKIN